MNPQEIKEFLKSIKHTDIEEMEYHNGDHSLYFKKSEVDAVAVPVTSVKEVVVESKKTEEKDSIVPIKSTMVGTFVSASGADNPFFVKEGDNIAIDQKIGQIEAMKIIKDVKTKVKGKIVKVLVSNGQAIEYGQELFLVDTSK
jgi:acetyl-CoA carboxylase biotin carboxyl carrier protein